MLSLVSALLADHAERAVVSIVGHAVRGVYEDHAEEHRLLMSML